MKLEITNQDLESAGLNLRLDTIYLVRNSWSEEPLEVRIDARSSYFSLDSGLQVVLDRVDGSGHYGRFGKRELPALQKKEERNKKLIAQKLYDEFKATPAPDWADLDAYIKVVEHFGDYETSREWLRKERASLTATVTFSSEGYPSVRELDPKKPMDHCVATHPVGGGVRYRLKSAVKAEARRRFPAGFRTRRQDGSGGFHAWDSPVGKDL